MIRRASSLVLGAFGSSTTMNKGIIHYALRQRRQFQSPSFSSVAADKDLVEATFNRVLECEINSPKYTNLKLSQVKDAFHIVINNDSVMGIVVELEKKFPDGQKVVVRLKEKEIEFTNDVCEGDKEGNEGKKAIPMIVEVHKPGRYCGKVTFDITISKEDITIQSLEVYNYRKYPGTGDSQLDEPQIREMDYELQRCLSKYLEIRGITGNLASFLLEHVRMSKKEKELTSLKHLKKLTEK